MASPLTGKKVFYCFLAFFALVFAANIVMVWIAFSSWTGVQTDSTYEYSQNYQNLLEDAKIQELLQWDVEINAVRNEDGHAQVLVTAKDQDGYGISGYSAVAKLERPVQSSQDLQIYLAELPGGLYRGTAQNVSAGQWNLVVDFFEQDIRVFRSRNRVYLKELSKSDL